MLRPVSYKGGARGGGVQVGRRAEGCGLALRFRISRLWNNICLVSFSS